MNKNLARIILVLLAVSVPGYFVFMSFVSSQMSANSKKTWEAMKQVEFSCPPGTEVRKDRWSKLGYSRTCTQLKHGKWEAWSDGYKQVDGNYKHGKKHGEWVWYKSKDIISHTIVYEDGREVSGDANAQIQK